MQNKLVIALGVVAIAALIAGFLFDGRGAQSDAGLARSGDRLSVVASNSLVGDWVQQVAGEHVNLTVLIGPDASPHHIELRPSQIHALAKADLVLSIGSGLEPWLARAYKGAGSEASFVELSEGLPMLTRAGSSDDWIARPGMAVAGDLPACCAPKYADLLPQAAAITVARDDTPRAAVSVLVDAPAKAACADCGPSEGTGLVAHTHDTHSGIDPHVWMDVSLTRQMVVALTDALIFADESKTEAFEAGQNRYLAELTELEQWMFRTCQTIPDANRRLLTQHENMRYFAHRYGFALSGSLLGSLSTTETGPSALAMTRLLKRIQAQQIQAVFAENIMNTELAEQVAREADLPEPPRLITGALSRPGTPGDTYVGMMRHNTRTIVDALK
ncbi:MAG: metal ABC transporter substrate-binding protein [Opitutales bacterium]